MHEIFSDIETCDEENYHFVSSATTGRVLSDVQSESDIVTYEKTPQHFNSTVIGGIAMLRFEFTNWSVHELKARIHLLFLPAFKDLMKFMCEYFRFG
jgi:hypothetical protein